MNKYLFVLCPPYSGSTVLWQFLQTSPNVSAFPTEGQFLDSVKHLMLDNRWSTEKIMPWNVIKERWENAWDLEKPVLLEKSPAHLIRAFEIEQVFDESYFIVTIRNPYAFAEGRARRYRKTMQDNAEHWVRCARHQIRNIEGLKNAVHFTYEDFTENPRQVMNQILDFVPELKALDPDTLFEANTVAGRSPRKIKNLNHLKIVKLSSADILEINTVLLQHRDVMEYFGYNYIYPEHLSFGKRITGYAALKAARMRHILYRLRSIGLRGSLQRLIKRYSER